MGLRTLIEITACTGFTFFFLWATGKLAELKRRIHERESAFFKLVKENTRLTVLFQELTDEVVVKDKEIRATFADLMNKLATQRQTAQANETLGDKKSWHSKTQ